MTEAHEQYEAAIRIANTARQSYEADPNNRDAFRQWRDASELAIKWQRAIRLAGGSTEELEDELEKILAGD